MWFDPDFVDRCFDGEAPSIQSVFAIDGESYREQPGRKTLRFECRREGFFLKLHWPVKWREIFKNLLYLRKPVLGAKNEWNAIRHLDQHGLLTMCAVGYGSTGHNRFRQSSFLLTRELAGMHSLEEVCADWGSNPPPLLLKRRVFNEMARISRQMHRSGMNHRDYYLCHFLMPDDMPAKLDTGIGMRLYLIDLHRAQIRQKVPERWLIKDLGGLCFSALDAGVSYRDLLRFVRIYEARPLKQVFRERKSFYRRVRERADVMYEKLHGRRPEWPTFQ